MERRTFLKAAGLTVLPAIGHQSALGQSCQDAIAQQTSGPFYPNQIPLDSDADLVWVKGQDRIASGMVTNLMGKVVDLSGNPILGAEVEIWQTDAFGYYHHPRDRGGQAEAQFQGFGKAIVDGTGQYRFRTIRPAKYPGRTPHIHARVIMPGKRPITTQIYVQGERGNSEDYLYNSIPPEKRDAHTVKFPNSEDEIVVAKFNFVLGYSIEC